MYKNVKCAKALSNLAVLFDRWQTFPGETDWIVPRRLVFNQEGLLTGYVMDVVSGKPIGPSPCVKLL